MTKEKLDEFVLSLARFAQEYMRDNGGSMAQQAHIIDRRGNEHVYVMTSVLHGGKMREALTLYAMSAGGADAIAVIADARFSKSENTPEGRAWLERVRREAERGNYIIAEDPNAHEAVVVGGRSFSAVSGIVMKYVRLKREGKLDEIVFEAEPAFDPDAHFHLNLIPNIWEGLN